MGDYRTTTGEALPPPRWKRIARWRIGALLGLLAVSIIVTAGVLIHVDRYASAMGYVTTEEYAEVRPPMSGTVAEILVDSGQIVQAGAPLVRLDSSQETAVLEETRALLKKTEAEVARRKIEIAEKRRQLAEDIAILQLRVDNNAKKLGRSRELFDKGLVSGNVVEDLELQQEISISELNSLKSRDQSLFDRELEVLDREVEARRDAISLAELRVRRRDVCAPIGGQVVRYEFVIGELVRPESVLLEIFGGRRQILKLKIAERYAAKVDAGQRCTAVLAPYRGSNEIIFEGNVEGLRNVIQGDGDGTYRVAYCTFHPRGLTISPGTTAQARIYYGQSTLWSYLFGID